ncbi:MAG: CinA family nicotinamide mononucleotide deamidase-related protein [Anaerolineae bacterium]|jgi:nicotinamide-nucleotide amidase|nr:CinA family nicotinamide mononucleotide deamidase-related protein [Anaerolineae bacterium]
MNVEILSIGTELLLGEIVDTNSAYVARQLRDIGVNIFYLTTVGDNLERIAAAIRASLQRADVVLTTGGLGPTVDDMTRQAVAQATGRPLEFRPELLEQIAQRFRQLGSQMSENNRVQAYIPAGSIPIYNRLGTAPCFIVETDGGTVISLPGVPREMKDILATTVIPYLRERMGGRGTIKALVLRTAGIGESQIDARIADLMTWTNPTVGLAAHTGQTDIRITARADTEAEADRMIAEAEQIVRERVGEYIYGTGKQPLEEVFLALLRDKGWKLAVSYTGPEGDTFAARLGQSETVACETCNDNLAALLERLGMDPAQAVEPATLDYCQLSRAEAKRLATESGADVVIAIVTFDAGTGITALAAHEERSRCYGFGGANSEAPFWAGTWGMSMAWQLARHAVES